MEEPCGKQRARRRQFRSTRVSISRQWRSFFWDRRPSRRARIRQLVDDSWRVSDRGIRRAARYVFLHMLRSRCGTGGEPDGAGTCAIRDLKRQGFEIVAYEDGTESWSVKLRCLSLLAGAAQLLDSGAPNFDHRLQDATDANASR